MAEIEPWMRGPIEGVEPLVTPVFHSFIMVREDLAKFTAGVSDEDVWRTIGSLPPLGFHLRHIPGSVERLTTYLMNEQLSPEQIEAMKDEGAHRGTLQELLNALHAGLAACEERIRTIDPATIHEPRYIGRKRLPTTVLGLLVHIAEHTQRHLGQAITTAKLIRA
jgi:uncharacterized damage-inducible protein DinB